MAYELQAPNELPDNLRREDLTTIFLAGSIEMGKAERWQDRLIKALDYRDNLIFFNPRRADWDNSWKQDPTPGTQFHEQVTWELDHIQSADIAVFYFDPETQSPITLLELGVAISDTWQQTIVCCPDGYFRKGNVVLTCARFNVPVVNSFDELVETLKDYL